MASGSSLVARSAILLWTLYSPTSHSEKRSMKTSTENLPFVLAALLVFAGVARAENVDLSTVPKRDTVQLTIYNSEDLTLVRETRSVSFKKGDNPLQFSWVNTRIDPSSVELRFLDHTDDVELLDTTFPHAKPQMLYWNVRSEFVGRATIEISYFTSGITWSADYVMIANPQETKADLTSYVRVFNQSGEDYEDAQVRLVVGVVNLVEKIAELANMPMSQVGQLGAKRRKDYALRAMRESVSNAEGAFSAPMAAAAPSEPKQVIKEGLSEYFIFTIDGTETVPNGWSKRMLSFAAEDVPIKIQYRYRPQEYGDQLVKLYLMANDKESDLGSTPLPDGVYRTFHATEGGSLRYVAAEEKKYVAIGDKCELNLGQDKDVIWELITRRTAREKLVMKMHGADVYRELDGDNLQIDVRSSVAGWQDHVWYGQRVANATGKPIELEVRRAYSGDVTFLSGLNPTRHDNNTVQYTTTVANGQDIELDYEVVTKQGWLSKQNRVEIQAK